MNQTNPPAGQSGLIPLLVIALLVLAVCYRRRWKPDYSAHGTASWATTVQLRRACMIGGKDGGLLLGRTSSGALIRLPAFTHVLLCGGTGSGKGVSVIFPQLLSYQRGGLVVFDPKGDLFEIAGPYRATLGRVIRVAPFNGGIDSFNPLDAIPKNSPTLVDDARAIAEALVVRLGTEPDPHWNESAVIVITALLVLILLRFEGEERSLNSLVELTSDPHLLETAAEQLKAMGGIPARLGHQIAGFQDKEKSGVISTVGRHLAFLNSELVAATLSHSTFSVSDLMEPGVTLFLQIPPEFLEAMRNLLRSWIATLVRQIGRSGSRTEVLFLLDEASALGSLPALEEALVRGRSAGCRLLLAYQSDSQVRAAFKDKPTLIYDNCSTQIYLGANSLETGERISKMLGSFTQVLEGYSENESTSQQAGGYDTHGPNVTRGSGNNFSVAERALLRPEEVLQLDRSLLIAFVEGVPPICCRRILYYSDPLFKKGVAASAVVLWLLAAAALLIAWAALVSPR